LSEANLPRNRPEEAGRIVIHVDLAGLGNAARGVENLKRDEIAMAS